MKGFADQVEIFIPGFEKRVIHSDLVLNQKMAKHHKFSFMWHYTASTVISTEEQATQMRKFIGLDVIFTFKSVDGIKLMAKGIIKDFGSERPNGTPVGLRVYGISHTIVLDEMPKNRIFTNQTLKEIALDILFKEGPGEFYQKEAIQPNYSKRFDALAQYNETSFEFLKREAKRRGEWFYFDGMRMQLGQLKTSKIKLVRGSSVHNFNEIVKLKSHKCSLSGYDYRTAAIIRSNQQKSDVESANGHSKIAQNDLAAVSHPELVNSSTYTTQANNSAEIEEMVKLQTAGSNAKNVKYTGTSYLPLGLGQKFTVTDGNVQYDLVVIEVTHLSKVYGNYCCNFVAIPDDVYAPPYTDVKVFYRAEMQPAKVVENNDPERLGRVKVKFFWSGNYTQSDWMRVNQSYAGAGYGSYWIPEKGDEVMIAFEGADIDRPFVLSSFNNGVATPEYFHENNDFKVKKTRNGHRLLFEELKNIELADHRGNIFHIDSVGDTINITALQTINLKAKNINIIAEENITSTAGMNISETATINKSTNVGAIMNTHVGGSNIVKVIGDYHEEIDGDFHSEAKEDRKTIGHKDVLQQTKKNNDFHSKKNIQHNSGEGTSQN